MTTQSILPPVSPPPPAQPTGVNAENPWPGLEAFAESDCEFFFGRDEETAELLRLVRRETLTILFGQSGLGKTSLLRAGLFPKLRNADFLPLYLRLDQSESAPSLVEQVRATVNAAIEAASAEAPLWNPEETPWEYFHRQDVEFWSNKNRLLMPVLVFDQFEELFTLGRENAARKARGDEFITALADLIEHRPPAALKQRLAGGEESAGRFLLERDGFKVLLSLREDYLPDLDGLRPQIRSIMQNHFRIRRMNGRQAYEVVSGPGRQLVDRAVATQIVQLVAGAPTSSQPVEIAENSLTVLMVDPALLSLVCRELNNRRLALGRAQITCDLIAESKQEILERFYDDSLRELPAEVAVFIEDELLTRSGFRNNVALEDALLEPGMTQAVIDQLIKRRLLRCEERLGILRIELTHDVLTGVIRSRRDLRQRKAAEAELAAAARERDEANERLEAERARAKRERRKTIWAAATSVLAILCAIIGWGFYLRAERATRRAEAAQASADSVINFMSDDLRAKLYPMGQLQVLKEVNDRVLEYLKPVDINHPQTDVLARKGGALQSSGEILTNLGRNTESLAQHLGGVEVYREVVRRQPNNNFARAQLAWELNLVGIGKRTQGDLAGAIPFLKESFEVAQQTAAAGGFYANTLTYSRSNLAAALDAQGKAKEAMDHYAANRGQYEKTADDEKANDYDQMAFFTTCIDIGDAKLKSGDLADALKQFQRAHGIAEKMLNAKPADFDRQYNYSQSSDRLGTAYQASGKLNEARDAVKQSNAIFEKLFEHDQANTLWQRNYSVTCWRVVQTSLIRGGQQHIGDVLALLVQIRRNLATVDKTNADAEDDLSETIIGLGDYLLSHGKLEPAGQQYREALEIRTRTAGKDATNLDRQELLAEAQQKMGDWAAGRGEEAAALASYETSRAIRTKLIQQDPTNYIRKEKLADADEALSETLEQNGNPLEAQTAAEKALDLRQELAKKDPLNAQWQAQLAESHRKLGKIGVTQGAIEKGLEHLQQCGEIMGTLSKLSEDNVLWREQIIAAGIDRAALYTGANDARAASGLREVSEMQKALLVADPDHVGRQMGYAHVCWLTAQAISRFEPGSESEAGQMRVEARAIVQQLKGKVEFTREQQQWANEIESGPLAPAK